MNHLHLTPNMRMTEAVSQHMLFELSEEIDRKPDYNVLVKKAEWLFEQRHPGEKPNIVKANGITLLYRAGEDIPDFTVR